MNERMEKSVNIYKKMAHIPEINEAEFIMDGKKNNNNFCVEVTWLNRDLLKMKKVKSHANYFVSPKNIISGIPFPQLSDTILRRLSPSGKKVATICQNSMEMYIHIAENEGQQEIIDLKELDVHGMIYADPYISSLEWSTDEQYVLYIAEEKRPEAVGHYDSKFKIKDNSLGLGSKYLHRDHWGEQMTNQHQSVVVKLSIYNKNINALSVGFDLTAGEARFVPFTLEIIGVATVCYPVRLGRAYSSDREAVIFHIAEGTDRVSELTARGLHSERPRFSPDGTKLIYLQCSTFGSVVTTAQIWLMEWSSKQKSLLLDYVMDKEVVVGSEEFRGICAKGVIPSRCWDSGSNRIYFSALNRNTYMMCEMDVESKQVRVFPSKSSHVVLDVKYDKLLVKCSSATQPDCLLLGDISIKDAFDPCFRYLTAQKVLSEIPEDWYEILDFPVRDNTVNISAMYIGPTSIHSGDLRRPLILWPHGGPHAIRANTFNLWVAFLISMGYSIVLPNYRGSIGMGQKVMTSSIGRCGIDDVDDCKITLEVCLKRFSHILDETKIYGIGLSHGGFLTAHLVAKYPDMMKAVCLINSAVDIQYMATSSDIPEWAFLEYGMSYEIGRAMDKKAAERFYERSPISYVDNVVTPMLFFLGSDDVRTPIGQSLNYYRLLLARNVPTKVFIYPDNHPLTSLEAESDGLLQIIQWFGEHN